MGKQISIFQHFAGSIIHQAGWLYLHWAGSGVRSGHGPSLGAKDTSSSNQEQIQIKGHIGNWLIRIFLICNMLWVMTLHCFWMMTKLWVCICQLPPARLSLIFHELKWPIVLSNITFIVVLMTDIGRLWLGIRILSHNPLHHNVILQWRDEGSVLYIIEYY